MLKTFHPALPHSRPRINTKEQRISKTAERTTSTSPTQACHTLILYLALQKSPATSAQHSTKHPPGGQHPTQFSAMGHKSQGSWGMAHPYVTHLPLFSPFQLPTSILAVDCQLLFLAAAQRAFCWCQSPLTPPPV